MSQQLVKSSNRKALASFTLRLSAPAKQLLNSHLSPEPLRTVTLYKSQRAEERQCHRLRCRKSVEQSVDIIRDISSHLSCHPRKRLALPYLSFPKSGTYALNEPRLKLKLANLDVHVEIA